MIAIKLKIERKLSLARLSPQWFKKPRNDEAETKPSFLLRDLSDELLRRARTCDPYTR